MCSIKQERGTKMIKAESVAEVERERERERERATTLINNKQAKKLALLSILRASTKHENV